MLIKTNMNTKLALFGDEMPEGRSDRVLRVLKESNEDLSTTEIAKQVGISRSTVSVILETLAERGDIKKTRRVGKAQLFRHQKDQQTPK
ncbi:MAG: helix-turn-helix domain-containing protein [Candidatus Heimdallarchaeota archaeon]